MNIHVSCSVCLLGLMRDIDATRSAYRILKDLQMAENDHKESASSDSNKQGLWWKHIWKMKVQPKVRIFCWPNQFSRNVI
jgi:hypothetical protein